MRTIETALCLPVVGLSDVSFKKLKQTEVGTTDLGAYSKKQVC